MENLPADLRSLLSSRSDEFVLRPDGPHGPKIHCTVTTIDLPVRLDAVEKHAASKLFKRESAGWYKDGPWMEQYLPWIVKNFKDERKMFCSLTKDTINKIPVEVARHVTGKKFMRIKKQADAFLAAQNIKDAKKAAKDAANAAKAEAGRAVEQSDEEEEDEEDEEGGGGGKGEGGAADGGDGGYDGFDPDAMPGMASDDEEGDGDVPKDTFVDDEIVNGLYIPNEESGSGSEGEGAGTGAARVGKKRKLGSGSGSGGTEERGTGAVGGKDGKGKFGDMPCRDGVRCVRANCSFQHPAGRSIGDGKGKGGKGGKGEQGGKGDKANKPLPDWLKCHLCGEGGHLKKECAENPQNKRQQKKPKKQLAQGERRKKKKKKG